MSQLPDAFKGHDLTGWTVYVIKGEYGISRWTADGMDISIEPQYDGDFELFEADATLYKGTLAECLSQANTIAHNELDPVPYGGWAPAPIGSDHGWQDISTAPKDGAAFIGADAQTGRVSECYWSLFSREIHSYGSPVDLTHWRPLPAPPDAKP